MLSPTNNYSTHPTRRSPFPGRQRGFLLMTAVVLIVIAALILTVMVFLGATGTGSSVVHSQSGQALFVAESGTEYEQRNLARNLDWYRSVSDPMPSTTRSFGAGTFTVMSNLPATKLKKRIATTGAVTITVYTTDKFPSSGYLQIDDDVASGGEYVWYSSKTATTFTVALNTDRGQTVGGVASAAATHERGDAVYPVTTLTQAGGLANSCTLPTSFTIAANSKFLPAGTVDIEGEEILYTGSSTTGGTTTLTGVVRCQNGAGAAHALNAAVTPILIGDVSASYEAYIKSVGTVDNTLRQTVKTIQR
jgi:hypothetical protein